VSIAASAAASSSNAFARFYGGGDIIGVTCRKTSGPLIGGPGGGTPDYTFACDVQHGDHSIIPVQVMVSPDGSQWGVVG